MNMPRSKFTKKILLAALGVTGTAVLIIIGLYLSVILSDQPLNSRAASWVPWPVACSTRHCLTTKAWLEHRKIREEFSKKADTLPPSDAEILTTLLRQHLIKYAQQTPSVTLADATRYREEILNLTDISQLSPTLSLSLADYDRQVVLPFLTQENLRQQRFAENGAELWTQLAQERKLIVLLRGLRWDSETATVVER